MVGYLLYRFSQSQSNADAHLDFEIRNIGCVKLCCPQRVLLAFRGSGVDRQHNYSYVLKHLNLMTSSSPLLTSNTHLSLFAAPPLLWTRSQATSFFRKVVPVWPDVFVCNTSPLTLFTCKRPDSTGTRAASPIKSKPHSSGCVEVDFQCGVNVDESFGHKF